MSLLPLTGARAGLEILEILKELVSMEDSYFSDHDLSDYEAYIDHMVELRDGQLRECFKFLL